MVKIMTINCFCDDNDTYYDDDDTDDTDDADVTTMLIFNDHYSLPFRCLTYSPKSWQASKSMGQCMV